MLLREKRFLRLKFSEMKSSAFWTLKSSRCLDSIIIESVVLKYLINHWALLNPPLYKTPSGTSSINMIVSVQWLSLGLSRSKDDDTGTGFQVAAAFGSERMVKSVF